ncbi:hypothetical protein RJ55_03958 [Drechmeria coniospora]|nr:hypothetical protein RJ55_03958 [Drechmeria coniospora]
MLPGNETLQQVCEALSDSIRTNDGRPFRMTYCCDSQLCGVNNLAGRGKDPNVNWLVSDCQSIGYHSLVDPGPPEATYSCEYMPSNVQDSSCTIRWPVKVSKPFEPAHSNVDAHSSSTTKAASFFHDPSLSTTLLSRPISHTRADTPSGKVSTGVIVAVVLSAIVGVAVVAALVLKHFRTRRRYRISGDDVDGGRKDENSLTVPDSPTPLVSATSPSTTSEISPITPPALLQERKFLATASSHCSLDDGDPRHWMKLLNSSQHSASAFATETGPATQSQSRTYSAKGTIGTLTDASDTTQLGTTSEDSLVVAAAVYEVKMPASSRSTVALMRSVKRRMGNATKRGTAQEAGEDGAGAVLELQDLLSM